jgi:hypothetical protein
LFDPLLSFVALPISGKSSAVNSEGSAVGPEFESESLPELLPFTGSTWWADFVDWQLTELKDKKTIPAAARTGLRTRAKIGLKKATVVAFIGGGSEICFWGITTTPGMIEWPKWDRTAFWSG